MSVHSLVLNFYINWPMKTLCVYLICLLTTSNFSYAKTHLAHFIKESNGAYTHYLSTIEPATGMKGKEMRIGQSETRASLIFTNKESALIAVLLQHENKLDEVVILKKANLEEVNRIDVPKVKWSDYQGLLIPPVLIADDTKLIVISKGEEDQQINIYDINSKENIFKRNLGGYDYHISRSQDLNYITFESQSTHSRLFIAVDINNNKISTLVNLGQSEVQTHIYNNSLFFSSERSPKLNKYYALSKIDFNTNKRTNYKEKSFTHYVFTHDSKQDSLYIAGKNLKKKKDLFVLKFNRDNTYKSISYKKKVKPLKAVLNKNNSVLMIIGENKLAAINIKNDSLISYIRIPFDPLDGFMNADGSIGYVQENSGSEVANFDLINGKRIEQSNAGRIISQSVANLRKHLLGWLPNMLFDFLESNKNMLLDNNELNLFVINSTTNDLTIFDAKTLKKKFSKGTGFKTYFISQGPKSNSPILIIGENRISLVDSHLNNPLIRFNDAKIRGIDKENDILFYAIGNNLHIYDMLHHEELSIINQFNTIAIYIY